VDRGYPKSLDIWTNVRSPVDATVSYKDVTYFFSGNSYQIFDDYNFEVGFTLPRDASAERGDATVSRPSVRPSICLSVRP